MKSRLNLSNFKSNTPLSLYDIKNNLVKSLKLKIEVNIDLG